MNDLTALLGNIEKQSNADVISDGFVDFSSRTTTDFVPEMLPAEIELRGYQLAAVETILQFKRGILGFAPGMGKTPTALTAIANKKSSKTVIVIPPSLAYDPWEKELRRLFPWIEFEILTGRTTREISDENDVVIIGDSVVAWWVDEIKAWGPSILVVDEAQRHKNRSAKRAAATSEIAEDVRSHDGTVILLTGTLATNDAEEVWMPAQIAGIAKSIVGSSSYKKWCNRWCYIQQMMVEKKVGPKKEDTKSIWIEVPNGCTDPVGLHNALRETAYIRVEREDVVDMPEKLIVEHAVPVSSKGWSEYKMIRGDFESWLVSQGKDPESIAGSEKLVQLGKLVEYAALAKIEACADYVEAMVEQDEQIVVMAHHKSVVAAFQAELNNRKISNRTFTGSDSPLKKAQNIDAFKSGEVSVLIGNIQSAGTGLNLENSANLVFIQLPWSPAEFEQASDRIYRVTQTRTCTIHVLYANNTVEEHVMEVLNKKAVITDGINAGTGQASQSDSFADEVWDLMMED